MNDREQKRRLTRDILRIRETDACEAQSLAAGLAELQRRRRRRHYVQWAIPFAAAAAIAFAALLVRQPAPPEIVHDPPPSDEPVPSIVLTSRPVGEEIIVRSRPAGELVISSRTAEILVVRTAPSSISIQIAASEPSARVDAFTERQLLAALKGRPILLEDTDDGQRRLVFLREADRNLLFWEP